MSRVDFMLSSWMMIPAEFGAVAIGHQMIEQCRIVRAPGRVQPGA